MRKMKEIETIINSRGYSLNSSICEVIKKFNIKTLCSNTGIQKKSGFKASEIVVLLLMLPLMALENVHQLYRSQYRKLAEMEDDTIYRLKNNEHLPWRSLLYAVAKMFNTLTKTEKSPTDPEKEPTSAKKGPKEGVTAFIIDDTPDQRTGYKMENVSYVHDHIIKKSVLGFKHMVLGYFDGKSFHPIDFCTHTEKRLERKKAKNQFKKQADPKSPGGKRRKEAKLTKIQTSLQMIKRSAKRGFIADYVLCDSWFTSEGLINEIRSIKNGAMHIVAGIKNGNQNYGYKDGMFNAKQIINILKEKGTVHRCRRWGAYYHEAVVTYKSAGEVKLFMCRYAGQKKWRVFVTTNTALSFFEMMEIYGIRWTIEVFFRECKQYLGLGKCQSLDFDAQISAVTITFILYTLLAYLKRMESYETLGELFKLTQQDICEKNLAERLWELFEDLISFIIQAIAENGPMDVNQFKKSKEYVYVKELFESSFLFRQLDLIDMSA